MSQERFASTLPVLGRGLIRYRTDRFGHDDLRQVFFEPSEIEKIKNLGMRPCERQEHANKADGDADLTELPYYALHSPEAARFSASLYHQGTAHLQTFLPDLPQRNCAWAVSCAVWEKSSPRSG